MNKTALSAYFAKAAGRESRFGGFDCVRFVVEALHVGWDRDFRDVLQYSDRRSACAQLRAAGGLHEACCAELGDDRPIDELDAGSIAFLPWPAALGLVLEDRILLKHRRTIVIVEKTPDLTGWRTDGRRT